MQIKYICSENLLQGSHKVGPRTYLNECLLHPIVYSKKVDHHSSSNHIGPFMSSMLQHKVSKAQFFYLADEG